MVQWTVDFSFGHDDQILADPIGRAQAVADSSLRPVSDDYFNGSTQFLLRWDNLWGSDRLDVIANAAGITYGSKVEGGDTNLSLAGSYRRRLSSQVALDISGSGYQFRREEPTLGRPVFDFNLNRAEVRLGWAAAESWLLTTGVHQDWITFPGRFAGADSSRDETQRQFNLTVGGIRRLDGGGFVAGQMNYRWTRSNAGFSEYEGPVFSLRTRGHLTASLGISSYIAFGHRNYKVDSLSVLQRRDNTWQFGTTLQRRVSRQVSLFIEGSFLHQDSNLDVFDFNQARAAVGISIDLVAPRAWSSPSLPKSLATVSPTIIQDEGIRFRYLAPGASTVSLVGGFNGWDAGSHPLQGPDSEGIWETVIPVPAGVWRYAFVVDGEWLSPQDAPRYEGDGFGGRNGVVEVPVHKGDGSVTPGGEIRQNR